MSLSIQSTGNHNTSPKRDNSTASIERYHSDCSGPFIKVHCCSLHQQNSCEANKRDHSPTTVVLAYVRQAASLLLLTLVRPHATTHPYQWLAKANTIIPCKPCPLARAEAHAALMTSGMYGISPCQCMIARYGIRLIGTRRSPHHLLVSGLVQIGILMRQQARQSLRHA